MTVRPHPMRRPLSQGGGRAKTTDRLTAVRKVAGAEAEDGVDETYGCRVRVSSHMQRRAPRIGPALRVVLTRMLE